MTTMNRGQLTTLAAGESSAQLEKDTPAWRIARANEIFDYVMGPTCGRCKRETRPWPLDRGDRCAPKGWIYCIREEAS